MRMSTLREETVLYFSRFRAKPADWSNQDLAEFYRVESALAQAGFPVEFDRGLTDEGDPWCAFCRADTGDVVVHFARIDGRCVVASPALGVTLEGASFQEVVRQFLSSLPAVTPRQRFGRDGQLFLHPAAMIVALVATAFCASGPAVQDGPEMTAPMNEVSSLAKIIEVIRVQLAVLQNEGSAFRDNLVKVGILTAIVVALEFAATRNEERVLALDVSDQPKAIADVDHSTPGFDLVIATQLAETLIEAGRSVEVSQGNLADLASENDLLQLLADKSVKLAVAEGEVLSEGPFNFAAAVHGAEGGERQSVNLDIQIDSSMSLTQGQHSSQASIGSSGTQTAQAAEKLINVLSDLDIKSFSANDVIEARDAKQLTVATLATPLRSDPTGIEAGSANHAEGAPSKAAGTSLLLAAPTFDDLAQHLVLAFIKSDSDIKFLQEGETMVIFDSSDVMTSSVALDVKSWAFGVDGTISIIGASTTIDSILALHI